MFEMKMLKIISALPETRVKDVLVKTKHCAGNNNVSKGDTFANQEGMMKQMVVQGGHCLFDIFLCPVGGIFVELHYAEAREYPGAGGR